MRRRRALLLTCLILLSFGSSEEVSACTPAPDTEATARALELNQRGVSLVQAGDPEAALPLFREAKGLAPKNAVIKRNLSLCLIARGDQWLEERRYDQAQADYHEAAGLAPGDFSPAYREALACFRARRERDARLLLQRLVQEHPQELRAHDLLAHTLYRLGENAEAIRHWERALSLDPKNERLQSTLERARREEALEGSLLLDLGATHFNVKYDGSQDQALGRWVVSQLEQVYEQVGALLGRYPPGEVGVVIYPGRTFRSATGAHRWVAGLYDGKIRVPAGGLQEAPPAEVRRLLSHEYAHALLHAIAGPKLPTWLQEGFAQLAEGRSRADARRLLSRSTAPSLEALQRGFAQRSNPAQVRQLYAASCDWVHGLVGQGGLPILADLLDRIGRREALEPSLLALYGQDEGTLYETWRASLPPSLPPGAR